VSEDEQILQAIRTWAKAWADTSALTDSQVIPSDDDGGRPGLPYLAVYVMIAGIVVGHDETVYGVDGDGDPTYRVQGERRGSVTLHGYGAGSRTWLEALTLCVHDPAAVQDLTDLGLVVGRPGGIKSVPRMMNANREPHYIAEFPIAYRSVGPTRTSPSFSTPPVEHTVIYSSEPDTLPLDFTAETP
jgi:hypothetical protein